VIEGLVEGDTPKTKAALQALRKITEARSVLLVVDETDEMTWLSLRNAPEVHLLDAGQLNTYDVLCSDDVIFTKDAYEQVVARLAKSGKEEA